MNPWYWWAIVIAAAGVAWIAWVVWNWQEVSGVGFLLLLIAGVWAGAVWTSDEPASWSSPSPEPTHQCLVQEWRTHYDAAHKHDVGGWVCVGWAQ